MHNIPVGDVPPMTERLDLDNYLLLDLSTQQIRLTRSGQAALAKRFARRGIRLQQLRTLGDVENAITHVTCAEYRDLSNIEKESPVAEAIDDLYFILDGIEGRPLLPLKQRRERMDRAVQTLFESFGLNPLPAE